MKTHTDLRRLAIPAILVSTLLLLAARAASAPVPAVSKEEPVELSPFVVSELTETGYAATNTLEGSRLNTALRDTPGAISVFTKDFLDDLAATNLEEILRYDLSAEINKGDADPGGAGAQINMFGDQGLTFRVRGLVGGFSINGFHTAVASKSYNVERVGSTRGPNAILFGTGASGGNLNFRTRAPSVTRSRTSLEFKVAGTGNVSNRTALIYGPDTTVGPQLWEGASATHPCLPSPSASSSERCGKAFRPRAG
ncbi:MAG: TonB-dependent receptor plug domain-containing protein [Verrucomicrobia bacterium]|nr:TonB-dependent receptor plug domain-containing protein [Verrucomicrobiota bacterium]